MITVIEVKKTIAAPAVEQRFKEITNTLDFKKEQAFLLQSIHRNPYLLKCSKESFAGVLINAALTGLTLNPLLEQAYIIPRKVRKNDGKGDKWVLEAHLDPSYKGMISMMHTFIGVQKVSAHVVYDTDEFEYDFVEDKVIKYKPYYMLGRDKGDELGVFAKVVTPTFEQTVFLPIQRVNDIMQMSESYKANKDNSIWTGVHREEMIKKTAIRYLWKLIPKTTNLELQEKMARVMELFDQTVSEDFSGHPEKKTKLKAIEQLESRYTEAEEQIETEEEQEIDYENEV